MSTSQTHLKESLRQLGYFSPTNTLIPSIPSSCLPLITTLVDDLLHAQTRVTRLENDMDDAEKQVRELSIQVSIFWDRVESSLGR